IDVTHLRRVADDVKRHVLLDLPFPSFRVKDEFRVGVGATKKPVSTCAARRRAPGSFLVQLSSHSPPRCFSSLLRLSCKLNPFSFDPCCLLSCGFLSCGFLSCG